MINAHVYTTMAGDTFDSISLDFYNEESRASIIIQANLKYLNVIVFKGGEDLYIPVIQEASAETLPPWKRGTP